jgi:hypothetical protein
MNIRSSDILFVEGQCQNIHVHEGINNFLGIILYFEIGYGHVSWVYISFLL